MSYRLSELIELLKPILTILKVQNSIWNRCEGSGNRTGLTPETILIQLQIIDSSWDLLTVQTVLNFGMKIGALRQQRYASEDPNQPLTCLQNITGPFTTRNEYFVNCNMLFENNINTSFLSLLPFLCKPQIKK